jgi:hypothetical protein
MSTPQTEQELKEHLKEQIEFLQRSAKAYDEGYTSEAKRIATTLRVLLYDSTPSNSSKSSKLSRPSRSLLTLLGKDRMKFYNTAMEYDSGIASNMKLVYIVVRGRGDKDKGECEVFDDAFYRAPLDNLLPDTDVNRKTEFRQWWNQIVIIDQKKNKFSRKSLVKNVSNQDGGAHVDPELNDAYADLTRFNSLGWALISNNIEKKFSTNPELATIRQICHEVLKSLTDEFPELVSPVVFNCPKNDWELFRGENGVTMWKGKKRYLNSNKF